LTVNHKKAGKSKFKFIKAVQHNLCHTVGLLTMMMKTYRCNIFVLYIAAIYL